MKDIFTAPYIFYTLSVLCIILLLVAGSGYTIISDVFTIKKDNPNKKVDNMLAKIKAQMHASTDMKKGTQFAISELYGVVLKEYINENKLIVDSNLIRLNKDQYRALIKLINAECEVITVKRFIHDNHLFRYDNKTEWTAEKMRTVKLYLDTGKEILNAHYGDNNMFMPLDYWVINASSRLFLIIKDHTEILLEKLKTESDIYKRQNE